MSKKTERVNIELIHCINQIEDFFEYRYEHHDNRAKPVLSESSFIKKIVMDYIDQMTENLKKIEEEK